MKKCSSHFLGKNGATGTQPLTRGKVYNCLVLIEIFFGWKQSDRNWTLDKRKGEQSRSTRRSKATGTRPLTSGQRQRSASFLSLCLFKRTSVEMVGVSSSCNLENSLCNSNGMNLALFVLALPLPFFFASSASLRLSRIIQQMFQRCPTPKRADWMKAAASKRGGRDRRQRKESYGGRRRCAAQYYLAHVVTLVLNGTLK